MCCFAQTILRVFDTFIFARLTGNESQYLVYEMKYESETPNAMILPIPVQVPTVESSVKFIDLSNYEMFFPDMAKAFPFIPQRGIGCGIDAVSAAKGNIEVHEVGNFVASFVPTIDDFARLDPRFSIPKETWSLIPEYVDYGFVVFQLAELSGKPHPMAFEFKTRSDELFFPTVHIHDGEVHTEEDFDHVLFMQHAGFDSVVGEYVGPNHSDSQTGLTRSKKIASEYCDIKATQSIVAPDLLIHKTSLRGKLPNQDTRFQSNGDPNVPGLNIRRYVKYWPALIPFALISWFFSRRSRLKNQDNVNDSNES